MISSAIWYYKAKLRKQKKFNKPIGQVQFVVFEKFTTAYSTTLREKSCNYLLIMYMKKHNRRSKQTKFWKCVYPISNLQVCYNFALVLHENALIFMYIVNCFNLGYKCINGQAILPQSL